MSKERFVREVLVHQADAELAADLAALADETIVTQDHNFPALD